MSYFSANEQKANNATILKLGYKPVEVADKVVNIIAISAIISGIALAGVLDLNERDTGQGVGWIVMLSGISAYKYYKYKNKMWWEEYDKQISYITD